MPANTPTYNFFLPTVGGDINLWGGYLNSNWSDVEDLLDGTTPITGAIDIDNGTIDGVVIGDSVAGAGSFTTLAASGDVTFVGGTIDGVVIGDSIAGAGSFTTLAASGNVTFVGGTIDGVAVTGGSIADTTVDNTPIGGSTPASGTFTTLSSTGATTLAGISYPTTDGGANQVLQTDGAGNLTFGTAVNTGGLLAANNLSDLDSASTARTNLGLGTIAVEAAADYLALTGGTLTGPLKTLEVQETRVALSGTTPDVDLEAGTFFELTTSGNTTFTFSNPAASGTVSSFSLQIEAGGTHTITWPASVDWPDGTAPNAPASGETDTLTFFTADGGTIWYGFLAGDASA